MAFASTPQLDDDVRRTLLGLVWDAYSAGSFPVGALMLDERGDVVTVGRNRMGESSVPPGRLGGALIAHAEIDVLAQLHGSAPAGQVLVSSLEPCLLCRSAATLAHVPQVLFLADDPLWRGLERLPELNAQVARRLPVLSGPAGDVCADPEVDDVTLLCAVLPLAVLLLRNADGRASLDYLALAPRRHQMATRLVTRGLPLPCDGIDAALARVREAALSY